ncbi:MAG: sulfurtransferase TusA family protein [Marinosulfonomonas sp.]
MKYDHELDALGLLCPLPVLKARKRIAGLETGQVLRLLSDDPAAVIDVPHFCTENGHELIEHESRNDANIFYIQKK